ncbi:MAG: M23 family metallopeptidase [Polyangiaceae bacterium]|nr:M23 family metallopeptidase [Polyangiaceae bacterium]
MVSGYDLDRPDPEQRRGLGLSAVGHGGIDLQHKRGTEVRLVPLEHQRGDAVVVFVGELFGKSVVTLHTLLEGRRERSYVVIYGHLDGSNPGLAPGAPAPQGTLLGLVGDSGSEGRVHLHLEVRQVRDGVDPSTLRTPALAQPTVSIPCDPRNVLQLRQ